MAEAMLPTGVDVAALPSPGAAPLRPDRRTWLVGSALLAATLPLLLRPTRQERLLGNRALDPLIPKAIGAWRVTRSDGIIMPDALEGTDTYDDVVERSYAAPGAPPVMLVIAYGRAANRRLTIHDPEVCYDSQGFTVGQRRVLPIALGGGVDVPARLLVADRAERHETVLYWRRVGEEALVDKRTELKLYYRRALSGVAPDGVLVRMSTVAGPSADAARALSAFARAMIAGCSPAARLVLLGPVIAVRTLRAG